MPLPCVTQPPNLLFVSSKDRSTGSCVVDGRTYSSETSVPRDHPCHYCICYGGKIDCFWKQCAHIPDGCQVMAFQDTCSSSLYVCGNSLVIELSYNLLDMELLNNLSWHTLPYILNTVLAHSTDFLFRTYCRYTREGSRCSKLRTAIGCASAADTRSISIDKHPHNDKTTRRTTDVSTKSKNVSASSSCTDWAGGGSSFATSDSTSSSTRTDRAAIASFDPAFASGRSSSKEIHFRSCSVNGSAGTTSAAGWYCRQTAVSVRTPNETQDAFQPLTVRYYIDPRLHAAP